MTTWAAFAAEEPELAEFAAKRLRSELPSYLATVRAGGAPRIHPVTPIFTGRGLFLFMEPTSPKGRDLRERPSFALHSGVPDHKGTGGEVWVLGTGHPDDDPAVRAEVTAAECPHSAPKTGREGSECGHSAPTLARTAAVPSPRA